VYGGLAFDAMGEVISGATTIWFAGPFGTFKDMHAQLFGKQLELAETTKPVNGWKEHPHSGNISGRSNLEDGKGSQKFHCHAKHTCSWRSGRVISTLFLFECLLT
jgi:hypothetical protein